MNQEGWRASVESGERGAAIVAAELCGRAFWGAPTIPPIIQWDKHTVCRAQEWKDVSERPEANLYDFIVTSPDCSQCEYAKTCNSVKPYAKQTEERHEVKTNYATHMATAIVEPGKSTGKTQNLYIEIYQKYACWKETQENKHLGWYHPDKKGDRPIWYHFYQPMDDPEGDGKHIDATDQATETDKTAFHKLAQDSDSLIIKHPWGYIISMTAGALERLITKLGAQGKIDPVHDQIYKDVEIAKLIKVTDIKANDIDIIYTPVFREIGKNGEALTQYPIRKRYIPKWIRDKIIVELDPTPQIVTMEQLSKMVSPDTGEPLAIINEAGVFIKLPQGGILSIVDTSQPMYSCVTKEFNSPDQYIKYWPDKLYPGSPGRGGIPSSYCNDLDKMGILDTEGGALYDSDNLLSSQ